MAINEDTAALVAAQLTQAWATVFAQKQGAGGLLSEELLGKIADTYASFKGAVTEVPIRKPYDTGKLIE